MIDSWQCPARVYCNRHKSRSFEPRRSIGISKQTACLEFVDGRTVSRVQCPVSSAPCLSVCWSVLFCHVTQSSTAAEVVVQQYTAVPLCRPLTWHFHSSFHQTARSWCSVRPTHTVLNVTVQCTNCTGHAVLWCCTVSWSVVVVQRRQCRHDDELLVNVACRVVVVVVNWQLILLEHTCSLEGWIAKYYNK